MLFVYALLTPVSARSQTPPPVFRAGTDLIMIDVQVVSAERQEVPTLSVSEFEVRIAGRKRTIVLTEFLHRDEGQVMPRRIAPQMDAATRAACLFAFERVSDRPHAHYLLGIQSIDADRISVEHPKVKVRTSGLTVRRWAWRSRVSAPAAIPGHR